MKAEQFVEQVDGAVDAAKLGPDEVAPGFPVAGEAEHAFALVDEANRRAIGVVIPALDPVGPHRIERAWLGRGMMGTHDWSPHHAT